MSGANGCLQLPLEFPAGDGGEEVNVTMLPGLVITTLESRAAAQLVVAKHYLHTVHRYDSRCGICRGDTHRMLALLVAAVRGLSPDLQAELIGGGVERELRNKWLAGSPPTPTRAPVARVVGPWTPEQAEETA